MINSLKFEHFRCFQDFALENLAQLTIISGKNNSGKTTILEGIYLLLAFQRGDVLFNIDGFRGMDFSVNQFFNVNTNAALDPLKVWETLFYNMDVDKNVQISLYSTDGIHRKLVLEQADASSLPPSPAIGNMQPFISMPVYSNILKLKYFEDDVEISSRHFVINGLSLSQQTDRETRKPLLPFVIYFGPNILISQQTVAEWIGLLERKNIKNKLVRYLSELINGISDIFTVHNKTGPDIFCRIANGQSLPVRAMGDGINKLLNYITAIVANPKGIFLIDEIENGFHYSFYPNLWRILTQTAFENDSQIIFTSHSRECMACIYDADIKNYDQFSYIRLDAANGKICPVFYSYADLKFALDNEMEIR